MRSPLETLKRLPWLGLFQVAILTALAGCVLEYALLLGAGIPLIGQMLGILLSPAIGWIVIFVIALGVGATAVLMLERFPRMVINAASLWALVACVALILSLGQAIGLFPLGLIGMSYEQLIGILLGIFFKGQPYWKSYRRW